jgi:hypothetical protein
MSWRSPAESKFNNLLDVPSTFERMSIASVLWRTRASAKALTSLCAISHQGSMGLWPGRCKPIPATRGYGNSVLQRRINRISWKRIDFQCWRSGFNTPGIIFPVSAVFLEQIERYRDVLEHYSRPRLLLTQWETTPSLNVHVLNETRDVYRFFDATRLAEFLADSVVNTIRKTLPHEVEYLRRYGYRRRVSGPSAWT